MVRSTGKADRVGSTIHFTPEQLATAFQAALASLTVVQQPEAEAPAKQVIISGGAERRPVMMIEPILVSEVEVGDLVTRHSNGSYCRTVTDIVRRANGTVLLGLQGEDDCTGLILEPSRTVYRQYFGLVAEGQQAPEVEATEVEAPKGKKGKKSARKGRYSQPATKVQLRVVFDKAAGADYGTVAEDCKSEDGIVLARKGQGLDDVLTGLRQYNAEADEIGAPIYGFSIVGRNGNAVKASSLVAARKASANR